MTTDQPLTLTGAAALAAADRTDRHLGVYLHRLDEHALAAGADTAGSIRIPVAFGGVCGLMPTFAGCPNPAVFCGVTAWTASVLWATRQPTARRCWR